MTTNALNIGEAPIDDFYRIVDKQGHVQLTGATFDSAFDQLVRLRNTLPDFNWRMEHIENGKIVDY